MTPLLLYYITDRRQLSQDETNNRPALLEKIRQAAASGVDLIQLREKDLSGRQLEQLGEAALEVIRNALVSRQSRSTEIEAEGAHVPRGPRPGQTRLLINSRCDVALATGANGVHLRSDDISIGDARSIAAKTFGRSALPRPRNFLVAISCHSDADVHQAAVEGADFAVFGPVFGKRDAPHASPTGLEALRQACRRHIPVLALGGITIENASLCLEAGAAGVAGIRLFQDHDVAAVVDSLLRKPRRPVS